MGKLTFEVEEIEGYDLVRLGGERCDTRRIHKMDPTSFIELFERIATKFHFSITKEFFERASLQEVTVKERACTVKEKKSKEHIMFTTWDIVDFFINCNTLLTKNIDITELIKEFRKSGGYKEFKHSCSLSYLTSTYALNGYTDIQFLGQPDFIINQIPAELKVIHKLDPDKRFDERGADTFSSFLHEDICYDIGQAISNRLPEGIKQSAESVFIDLSAKSLSGRYLCKEFDSVKNILPEPKKYRMIFFCKIEPPIGQEGTYSLFGTYVDFDPDIWNFLKRSKRKVKHARVSGVAKVKPGEETTLIEIPGRETTTA